MTRRSGADAETIAFASAHTQLQASLLSHSRRLRLASLRLLQSQASEDDRGVVDRSLAGEEVAVDVQGVRERVLRITRMNQILRDGDEPGADIAIRWLIGMLYRAQIDVYADAIANSTTKSESTTAMEAHCRGSDGDLDEVWRAGLAATVYGATGRVGGGSEGDATGMDETH